MEIPPKHPKPNQGSDIDPERVASSAKIVRQFFYAVPFSQALGIDIGELSDGFAIMALPYQKELVGNPETGVLHGGVVTSLMDACSGAAAFMKLSSIVPIATLDLRIDYLRPAPAGEDLIAEATCYRVGRDVAFTRCMTRGKESGLEIASAAGSFMVGTMMSRQGKTQQ